jgi:hypothetical protein
VTMIIGFLGTMILTQRTRERQPFFNPACIHPRHVILWIWKHSRLFHRVISDLRHGVNAGL